MSTNIRHMAGRRAFERSAKRVSRLVARYAKPLDRSETAKHDEASIDLQLSRFRVVHRHRIGVAAQAIVGLVEHDIMGAAQHVRAGQPGNT
jgi:hypothetical protein